MDTSSTPSSTPDESLIGSAITGLGTFAARALSEGLSRLLSSKDRHQGPLLITILLALVALVTLVLVTARERETRSGPG